MTKATTVVLLIALCVVSCSAQDRRRRRDRSEPTFRRCPTDTVIIQTDPGKSTGTIKYPDFDVHDLDEEGNTTPVSKIKLDFRRNSPKAGDQKEVGLYPVHVVATDPSNNAATCKFTVQVVDQESPRFTACKPNKTEIIVSRGDQSALLQYEQPKAIDNVDGEDVNVTFVEGVRSGEVLENLEETTEVVWEATDSAGNRAFCKFFLRLRQTVMSETELQAMMDDLPNAVMAVRSVASPAAPGELNDNDLTAGLFETSAVRERQERMPNRMDLPLTARSGRGDNIHILSKHMNIAVADLGPSMPSEGETLEGDDLHALALSATSFRKPTTVEKKHRVGLLDEPSERRLQQGRIFNGDGSGLAAAGDAAKSILQVANTLMSSNGGGAPAAPAAAAAAPAAAPAAQAGGSDISAIMAAAGKGLASLASGIDNATANPGGAAAAGGATPPTGIASLPMVGPAGNASTGGNASAEAGPKFAGFAGGGVPVQHGAAPMDPTQALADLAARGIGNLVANTQQAMAKQATALMQNGVPEMYTANLGDLTRTRMGKRFQDSPSAARQQDLMKELEQRAGNMPQPQHPSSFVYNSPSKPNKAASEGEAATPDLNQLMSLYDIRQQRPLVNEAERRIDGRLNQLNDIASARPLTSVIASAANTAASALPVFSSFGPAATMTGQKRQLKAEDGMAALNSLLPGLTASSASDSRPVIQTIVDGEEEDGTITALQADSENPTSRRNAAASPEQGGLLGGRLFGGGGGGGGIVQGLQSINVEEGLKTAAGIARQAGSVVKGIGEFRNTVASSLAAEDEELTSLQCVEMGGCPEYSTCQYKPLEAAEGRKKVLGKAMTTIFGLEEGEGVFGGNRGREVEREIECLGCIEGSKMRMKRSGGYTCSRPRRSERPTAAEDKKPAKKAEKK